MSIETTNALRFLVTVNASPERAWHVFTAEIGSWWPSETHSIAADEGRRPDRVVLEPLNGGEIYEESASVRRSWATILAWEPPSLLRFEWHVSPDKPPTEVTVTFTPDGAGTKIELVHAGWEAYADGGSTQSSYGSSGGWKAVLSPFEERFSPRAER